MVNGSINAELYEQLYRVYRPQFVWRPAGFQGQGEAVFRLNGYEPVSYTHLRTRQRSRSKLKLCRTGADSEALLCRAADTEI